MPSFKSCPNYEQFGISDLENHFVVFQVLNLTREQYALDEYTVVADSAIGFVVGDGVIFGADCTAADGFVLDMGKVTQPSGNITWHPWHMM